MAQMNRGGLFGGLGKKMMGGLAGGLGGMLGGGMRECRACSGTATDIDQRRVKWLKAEAVSKRRKDTRRKDSDDAMDGQVIH